MSDYETSQKTKSFFVGLFIVLGLCAFSWLVFKFGELPVFVSKIDSYDVKVQLSQAPGIRRDTSVRFCGYQVGKVTHVKYPSILKDVKTGQSYYQSLVTITINNKYNEIPANADIKLVTKGLGSSFIEIFAPPEYYTEDANYLCDGQLVQGSIKSGSDFLPEKTMESIDTLIASLVVLVDNTNEIVGDPNNQGNLSETLANLTVVSYEAKNTLLDLQSFFNSGMQTSQEISKTVVQLSLILEKIHEGEGSASRFINDAKLYESLVEDTRQLKLLIEDVKKFINKMNEKGVQIKL